MKAGKVSENILLRSVIKPVQKTQTGNMIRSAGIGEDCAVFMSCNQISQYANAIQTGVISCEGMAGCIFHSAVNTLAAGGACVKGVLVSLLLPTSADERLLKDLMNEMIVIAKELSIEIAGGHTQVSKEVSSPVLTVTAFGERICDHTSTGKKGDDKEKPLGNGIRKAMPGDDLVITKDIALEGTYLLSQNAREKLLERYPASMIDEAVLTRKELSVVPEAAVAASSGECAMHDASHGGIYTAMWEMAQAAGTGLEVELKKIPIRQQTVEICDYLEINPYELISGGSLLVATPFGEKLCRSLKENGIEACVVGKVTADAGRVVLNGDERRYLEPFRGDSVILN